jgi:transcriptional regulator with XRE-family HTH domain
MYLEPVGEPAVDPAALGTRIGDARRARGLTQQALADALGVDRKTVNRWETGRTTTLGPNLARLGEILGWPPEDVSAILRGHVGITGAGGAGSSTAAAVAPLGVTRLQEFPRPMRTDGPEASFDLDPTLAAEVEITDQARRLSWLTGTDSPIGEVGARRLAVAVEAVMTMALPQGLPPRAEQPQIPQMSPGRRPAERGAAR